MANSLVLDGFLCGNPEKKRTQSGKSVTTARICHRDTQESEPVFLDVYAWEAVGETLASYKKGDLIKFSGLLTAYPSLNKDGKKWAKIEAKVETLALERPAGSKRQPVDGMAYMPKELGGPADYSQTPSAAPVPDPAPVPAPPYRMPGADPAYDLDDREG